MNNENVNIIIKSIFSLKEEIKSSELLDDEKHALITLLDSLNAYYSKKRERILKKSSSNQATNEKLMVLESSVTDILMEINDILIGNHDIYYFTSVVNKKIK